MVVLLGGGNFPPTCWRIIQITVYKSNLYLVFCYSLDINSEVSRLELRLMAVGFSLASLDSAVAFEKKTTVQ